MFSEVEGMGRPNTALVISEAEKKDLAEIVRSRSMPHSLVRRAKIVLRSAGVRHDKTNLRKPRRRPAEHEIHHRACTVEGEFDHRPRIPERTLLPGFPPAASS